MSLNQVVVGILPTSKIFIDDDPYNDRYMFYNVYTKRIFEAGGIPVGILLSDGKLNISSLEMCDAFLICGGQKIEPYLFEVISYAIASNKPLLGICMGMQSIGVYSFIEELLTSENRAVNKKNIYMMYDRIRNDNVMFLNDVNNHYNCEVTRENFSNVRHFVDIKKDSKLYSIFKTEKLGVLSMHHHCLNKYGKNVMINCFAGDVIEGLEYKRRDLCILGIQWHPELEKNTSIIFSYLINAAKKRKDSLG